MIREESAFGEGLVVGQRVAYARGDLFREDFDYPVNPYVTHSTLRTRFHEGMIAAWGADFQADFALWQEIETEYIYNRAYWSAADIQREGRQRLPCLVREDRL